LRNMEKAVGAKKRGTKGGAWKAKAIFLVAFTRKRFDKATSWSKIDDKELPKVENLNQKFC
jgi:hypothetical protein